MSSTDATFVEGVDMSFAELTHQRALCLIQSGVEVMYQCGWTAISRPPHVVNNLRVWQGFDKLTGLYISLNRSMPGRWHVDQARLGIPDDVWERLRFVAIDVELPGITEFQCLDACQRIIELGKTVVRREVGCYTNWNTWVNVVGNPSSLSQLGVLLLNAFWDRDKDVDFPRLPFGGWQMNQLLAEQYDGGHVACGIDVDSDMFQAELLARPDEEEDNLTVEQLRQRAAVQTLFETLSAYASQGQPAPDEIKNQVLYLITAAGWI